MFKIIAYIFEFAIPFLLDYGKGSVPSYTKYVVLFLTRVLRDFHSVLKPLDSVRVYIFRIRFLVYPNIEIDKFSSLFEHLHIHFRLSVLLTFFLLEFNDRDLEDEESTFSIGRTLSINFCVINRWRICFFYLVHILMFLWKMWSILDTPLTRSYHFLLMFGFYVLFRRFPLLHHNI